MTQGLTPRAVRCDVAVDGMRFSVWRSEPNDRASGSSAATPVLLLHGVPETAAMWQHLAAELSTDRVVLAPDLPGLGRSELRGPYDIRTVAARIAALGLHEAAGPIDVAGHDWGGAVALVLARSHPDLVRRIVILNTAHRSVDLRAAWHIPALSVPVLPEAAFRLAGAALVHRLIAYGWRSARPLDDVLAAHYQAAYADPRRVSAMLGYYRDNFRPRAARAVKTRAGRVLAYRSPSVPPPRERRRPAVGRTALVVWGARDPVLPDSVRRALVQDLGDCPCVIAPDAGHFVLEEAPEIAIPAIASFLRGDGNG